MKAIAYKRDVLVDPKTVADLFRNAGLRRPVDDLARIAGMMRHANLNVTAWQGARLVGIARALTDFNFCCYLSDLAVAADIQRQGIGRELVRRVAEAAGDRCVLLLLSAPEAMAYYPKLGFERVECGWLIPRGR